ncbi:zinc finger, HIT-type containing 1 [Halteromyces radiatus]|uniref:zinc finger, HIT-type containing 1 n=1 Tax=Halteromyces radiatus TaxID=101107 RepID=UPI00221EA0B4|nr:zinc finger, HIT-type containing 1 [Halteromyces radiatus]KAI8096907.1 zinc finger, HIT-type containing 1 [Halteromyces radiatus]
MKKNERNKQPIPVDTEAHQRHLRRQLDSLERDNHQSLNDVEGLISVALAAQEQNDEAPRKSRHKTGTSKSGRASVFSTKANLSVLLEDAHLEDYSPDIPTYLTCNAAPSKYPPRHFCSVCGFSSSYKCLRCGMKYCSLACLNTHKETRCMKWTV